MILPQETMIDDRYEVLDTVGAGGFGSVYKARQGQLDRIVAIKTLNTLVVQGNDGVVRFEREAKAINALKHKNIVGFYGYGVWQQIPYMVMEFVEGDPLELLLASGPLDPARVLNIAKQMFEALRCAHASGVVHRDLKPANILIDANDNIKVIDFGLAKLMPGYGVPGQKLTDTGWTLGTCHYMPPEQAMGGRIDQRADIYSAGCIMYQMLSGKLPFDAPDNVAIMIKHLHEEPAPLPSGTPYRKALATVVRNCIEKDASGPVSELRRSVAGSRAH